MRLIDADAIIKEIKARNPDDVSYEDAWAITCIEHAPTIEPQCKTGKWMVDPDGRLHCSRCLENPTNRVMIDGKLVYDMTPIVGKMRYCPNCGADMRKDGD